MLHIVSKSPFTSTALSECLAFIQPESALLLLSSAVYAIEHPSISTLTNIGIYALQEDVEARGLKAHSNITLIDYSEMVTLTEHNHPIQTWS